jgi:hypothetical protein
MNFFKAKIQKLSQNITPFAGVSYINSEFDRCGLSELIDNELGRRWFNAKYSYSDIFRNWANIFFCGGDCAEDIQVHLRETLQNIPDNIAPSADTQLLGIKELAVKNTLVTSKEGKTYQFNINEKMNELNIKSLILTKQLQKGQEYDFDYDNQIIVHEKYDAKPTYKKTTGYFPGTASIADKVIYIENRDGNANVKTKQENTLERIYKLFKKNELGINRSRMDAGSYSKKIIEIVAFYSKLFYIRANKCESLTEQIHQIEDWQSVEINFKNYEVVTIKFTQFFENKGYRLVVMREKNDNPQLDLFDGNFIYRCILTNDWESTEKEVIEYYNARGSSEKLFDIMNNDFGWKHLPCSDMNYNTVYLILTAIIKNFYNYIIQKVSQVFTDIPATARLKKFIFRFICVSGRWIYRSRQWTLQLYTDRPYEKLVV